MQYIIITPAKDEREFIEHTLRTVCAQTLIAKEWIIVNDGSTDNTAEIVRGYVQKHPWIKLINNDTMSQPRAGGGKVVRAFYAGYNSIDKHQYDFIVKLDADLELPHNYFEQIGMQFAQNPKVGMCAGICIVKDKGEFVEEPWSHKHIRGPIKAYRKECFDAIGGLKETLGWDGIDEIEASFKGWEIKVIPSLRVIHHRKTSSKINRGIKDAFLMGQADYRNGYRMGISLLRCIKRSIKMRPYVVCGFMAFFGYCFAFSSNAPKVVTQESAVYANRYKSRYYYSKLRRQFFSKKS